MKRHFSSALVALLLSAGMAVFAQTAPPAAPAPAPAPPPTPVAANVPEIPYESVPDPLKIPDDIYFGETVGVATNSKGNIFIYTRTGSPQVTIATERTFWRGNGGSRLFEFDASGKFIREIGQGLYGFLSAHVVRVDAQDNIWAVDEGASVVLKFNPEGRIVMVLGRKPEEITVPGGPPREGGPAPQRDVDPNAPPGTGVRGDLFVRPTDVAWDAAGNIFVADGYGNSRVAKFDKNGRFLKSFGSRGSGPGQFNLLHTMATDAQGNVYVGDRNNRRIQVFDNEGTFKTMFTNIGAPWAICITPGPHQYLYTSNSNNTGDLQNGEIYKMELDGRIVGKFGRAGHLLKEFGSTHEIDCRKENELLIGEVINWRMQKILLKPSMGTR